MPRHRRKLDDSESAPPLIRVTAVIRLDDHPDIAHLYRQECHRLAAVTREALDLYAFLRVKTGERAFARILSAVSSGSFDTIQSSPPKSDDPLPSPVGGIAKQLEERKPVGGGGAYMAADMSTDSAKGFHNLEGRM